MIELLKTTEKDDLFIVQTIIKGDWLDKLLGKEDKIDEIIFNTINGDFSQSGLICRGSFDIAMHEYYKKYGTYGAIKN